MKASNLIFDDYEILITRKKIKNIYLKINREGLLVISAPFKTSTVDITDFVESKKIWISTQLNKSKKIPVLLSKTYSKDEIFYFLGKSYKLNFLNKQSTSSVVLSTRYLNLFLSDPVNFNSRYLIGKWYREQCNKLANELLVKWQEVLGVKINKLSLGYLKSRWGSCQPQDKNIWLNIDLIQMPKYCLEYVVVHELVHLFEPSHNFRFKTLMDKYLPDWREFKKVLNRFAINKY